MPRFPVITEARYSPKLKPYLVLLGTWYLTISVIGIVLIPFWLLIGPFWARRFFTSLSCQLTERALIVKKGLMFRTEKTIPLDRIQDLSLKEGPVLRKLGLSQIGIETAGQASQPGTADAALIGIEDAIAFRDQILDMRDALKSEEMHAGVKPKVLETAAAGEDDVLVEIRDSLLRIEAQISKRVAGVVGQE